MALTPGQKQALTKLRNSGTSDLGVGLDSARLNYLLSLIAADLDHGDLFPELPADVPGIFARVESAMLRVEGPRFRTLYERLLEHQPAAETYLLCLGTLLKARLKYEKILQAQPIPTVEQVGPRSLLEFGHLRPRALAAFLFWRKWIYDIDNRAGQETGYLFEPIMAKCIGGVPYSASKSPVRRRNGKSGRQVDCILDADDDKRAYELKLRVTIAASGQGRWGEELAFPGDCVASSFRPILIVFDDTPNEKLAQLTNEFRRVGGDAYTGAAAWAHLEEEAGPIMSQFLEKYVREPLNAILEAAPEELPRITFSMEGGKLQVNVADDELVVERHEDEVTEELQDDADAQAELLPDDIDDQAAG